MRVAIANRGEVAVRIIRACQEMGLTSVLLHSTPDQNTPAFRMADETLEIPGTTALDTYLNISKVVAAAKKAQCTHLHPGFGFLSENADFVQELERNKIIFVGPTSESIRIAGNKIKAKNAAIEAGVPTIPACTKSGLSISQLLAEAKKIGFPCIIKAAAGGGGKGMKVSRSESDFEELCESAKREALNAFGSDVVFIEKYFENPRHIEVQVIADRHGDAMHFYERECSVQRRHQKIFEETPSPALTDSLRNEIAMAALKLVKHVNYTNAGTVEFLLDKNNKFYFMELNTRLQVEHTVTEMVCGIDLVQMQFRIAMGENLNKILPSNVNQRGHSMEVRIYAEDPERGFLPSTGQISEISLPLGPHRRFDFGFESGDTITPLYDPMIGKVITWAPTREENLDRMYATLNELVIFGVPTNIEFLKAVLLNEKFVHGNLSTGFIDQEFPNGYTSQNLTKEQQLLSQKFAKQSVVKKQGHHTSVTLTSPWSRQ